MTIAFWKIILALGCISKATPLTNNDCQVNNFKVKQDFDRTRYAGTWYAVQKKDPKGLFLQDNIVANFGVDGGGKMNATAKGIVTLVKGYWVTCANMFGTFEDTDDPAKFKMKYWGAAAYLQTGNDPHWVIDTDYDTYAIHYSCRALHPDGTCEDSYSFIFSRDAKGLPPQARKIVKQRQEELCLAGEYRRVVQEGKCKDK
ncbi:retinol-binding protein 4 [Protopterus annectens]|uniref:retinol-binding protein 4 n=1 Tax=Protopterus annectens TaxID=7888 RepID=UPI001CFBF9F7|nr:retinol-binding protein 4 [Protopterus annectens]